jgi:hypothetical protein
LVIAISSTEVKLDFESGVNNNAVLTVTRVESFSPSTTIFLDDQLKGTTTNLKKQSTYSLQHNPFNNAYRFKLRFNGVTGIDETPVETQKMSIYNDKLYKNPPQMTRKNVHIEIFNLMGQKLFNQSFTLYELTMIKPGIQGIVLVRLASDSKLMTLKGIIN